MARSQAKAETDDPETAAAARALRRHAAAVRRRELEEALARLEARGEVTDEQREAMRALADRLTAGLVGPALAALATGEADPEAVATLFDG